MKKTQLLLTAFILVLPLGSLQAQEEDEQLKISGKLLVDERFLLKDDYNWAWNETRLSLNLDKKITDASSFHSEVWLRSLGLPSLSSSADLYNKGIIDPYNLEIREAYVQVNGFLSKNLDLRIGRQRIAWGSADKLNPTDNLNPYDMEDILDFGRHRGSDALRLDYYFSGDFSLQAVYLPFFQPANLPLGMFSGALAGMTDLPDGMTLVSAADTLLMPAYNLKESSTAGFKFKGFLGGVDFSASYVWGLDGLPLATRNTLIPVNLLGGVNVQSELSFQRVHIFGADLSTSLGGIGLWAEGALFLPSEDVVMTTDLSAFYPLSPDPVSMDSLLLDHSKPYLKFIVGLDYFLPDGSYFNLQYMHGFIHERGRENMNDYFFTQLYKTFFNEKLKVAPLGGGFIVSDWKDVKNNYALVYMPELSYQATGNTGISLSGVLFTGDGANLFAGLKDYNMLILKVNYSF